MRKILLTLLLLTLLLLTVLLPGCGRRAMPEQGDFSLALPEGYAVSEVTERECAVTRAEDGEKIGGIAVTALGRRDLKDTRTKAAMAILREFHGTGAFEFMASNWGNTHPIITVNLSFSGDGQQQEYYHAFFEKEGIVYHLWLDLSRVEFCDAQEFLPFTGVE